MKESKFIKRWREVVAKLLKKLNRALEKGLKNHNPNDQQFYLIQLFYP